MGTFFCRFFSIGSTIDNGVPFRRIKVRAAPPGDALYILLANEVGFPVIVPDRPSRLEWEPQLLRF